jgi:hypothetical protein
MTILSAAVPVMPQEIRFAEHYLKMLYLETAVSLLRGAAIFHMRKPASLSWLQGVSYEL